MMIKNVLLGWCQRTCGRKRISKRIFYYQHQRNSRNAVLFYEISTAIWVDGRCQSVNTLRPRQNGRHFAADIFKYIFLNENVWIPIKISLKFVPKGWINNIPALVPMMAWRRPGDKPLSEPMLDSLLTHICVTRPQWVKGRVNEINVI